MPRLPEKLSCLQPSITGVKWAGPQFQKDQSLLPRSHEGSMGAGSDVRGQIKFMQKVMIL